MKYSAEGARYNTVCLLWYLMSIILLHYLQFYIFCGDFHCS